MSNPRTLPVGVQRARDALATATQNLAIQDVLAVAFHFYMWMRISAAPDSHDAHVARRFALALFTITASTIVLARGEIIRQPRIRAFVYRVGLFFPMLASYFELRYLLPALQPVLVDQQLFAIDRVLVGTTPSIWLAQFNELFFVEWIAFFYYSYFWILALTLLPALFFDRGPRLQELMIGALAVCALGHIGYTLVPGAGPYATIGFDEPLRGGFWWRQVEIMVSHAGAQLDIFPSLHTAYPSFFALHAFAHRDRVPYRYAWPLYALFAVNILVATMFLRWHWMIDVIAGLALALFARQLALIVSRREAERGEDGERQPVWEPLFGPLAPRRADRSDDGLA